MLSEERATASKEASENSRESQTNDLDNIFNKVYNMTQFMEDANNGLGKSYEMFTDESDIEELKTSELSAPDYQTDTSDCNTKLKRCFGHTSIDKTANDSKIKLLKQQLEQNYLQWTKKQTGNEEETAIQRRFNAEREQAYFNRIQELEKKVAASESSVQFIETIRNLETKLNSVELEKNKEILTLTKENEELRASMKILHGTFTLEDCQFMDSKLHKVLKANLRFVSKHYLVKLLEDFSMNYNEFKAKKRDWQKKMKLQENRIKELEQVIKSNQSVIGSLNRTLTIKEELLKKHEIALQKKTSSLNHITANLRALESKIHQAKKHGDFNPPNEKYSSQNDLQSLNGLFCSRTCLSRSDFQNKTHDFSTFVSYVEDTKTSSKSDIPYSSELPFTQAAQENYLKKKVQIFGNQSKPFEKMKPPEKRSPEGRSNHSSVTMLSSKQDLFETYESASRELEKRITFINNSIFKNP